MYRLGPVEDPYMYDPVDAEMFPPDIFEWDQGFGDLMPVLQRRTLSRPRVSRDLLPSTTSIVTCSKVL